MEREGTEGEEQEVMSRERMQQEMMSRDVEDRR